MRSYGLILLSCLILQTGLIGFLIRELCTFFTRVVSTNDSTAATHGSRFDSKFMLFPVTQGAKIVTLIGK